MEIPTDPDVMALEVMGLVQVPYGSSVVVVWDMMTVDDDDDGEAKRGPGDAKAITFPMVRNDQIKLEVRR